MIDLLPMIIDVRYKDAWKLQRARVRARAAGLSTSSSKFNGI